MNDYGTPKNETIWTVYKSSGLRPRFVITSKPARDMYFLYEITEDGIKKIGKSVSPSELEEKFNIMEKIS